MSIKETVVRVGSRGLLLAQKHSPEILTTVGIIGGVTAAILGAKATLKLEPIVDEIDSKILIIKDRAVEQQVDVPQKQITKAYVKGGLEIVKLYGPSVTLGVGSIVCIVAAHGILHRRNVAYLAMYKVAESALTEYRKRFIEEFGEDKDRDYIAGVYEEVKTAKDGTITIVARRDPNSPSMYAQTFDASNIHWESNPEFNKMFLTQKQNYLNNILRQRGHVFLNEVYDELGFDRTQPGQLVGWTVRGGSDNFIDFGMYEFSSDDVRKFVNSSPSDIFLDFNVDGPIYDLI